MGLNNKICDDPVAFCRRKQVFLNKREIWKCLNRKDNYGFDIKNCYYLNMVDEKPIDTTMLNGTRNDVRILKTEWGKLTSIGDNYMERFLQYQGMHEEPNGERFSIWYLTKDKKHYYLPQPNKKLGGY